MAKFKNRWFSSDHHQLHENILTFKNDDGSSLRPEFATIEEMTEHMIEQHNKVVKPHDTVYFLGDFAIKRKGIEIAARMNGKKRLIKGNHDIFKLNDYLPYFDDIMSCKVFVDLFICTHIPVHPDCVSQRWKANVHGHLHSNLVVLPEHYRKPDMRYQNVSMEQLDDYTPKHFDELVEEFKKRGIYDE